MYLRIDIDAAGLDRATLCHCRTSDLEGMVDAKLKKSFKMKRPATVATWINDGAAGGRKNLLFTWKGRVSNRRMAAMEKWIINNLARVAKK